MTANLNLESLLFACFGVSLLFVHYLRIRSVHNPRHALKDTGGDLVIHRSASHLFAWFLILVAVLLIRYKFPNNEPSAGRAWSSGAFGLVAITIVIFWSRMLRRFTLTHEEISDIGHRRRMRIPMADVKAVEVRHRLGFLPVLRIMRHDGTTKEIWAFDFIVTAESVAAAISARIPTVRHFVFGGRA